jgi:3-hydroxybutyryl-CoA dehydrogenase
MKSNEIRTICVVGSGMMGHAIAQEFAGAGYDAILLGRSKEKLGQAKLAIERNLRELVEWEILPEDHVEPTLDRVRTTTVIGDAAGNADLVVEAVIEDLEVKQRLFSDLDNVCPKRTIFASNTSTLLPSMLAAATKRPDRVLVAHYFNPPYLMPLVEIVRGDRTSDETASTVYELMKAVGKSPIICQKEAPGFIANRLQLVLWREAFNIVQRGIASPEDVDTAVKNSFGRRLGVAGPFEIYEHNDGYDLTLQCEKYMLPDMNTSPVSYPLLLEKVEKGELGAKTGKGFYQWTPEFTRTWRERMLKNLIGYLQRP